MDVFIYILISTFLISGISFVGVLTLVLKEKFLEKILLVLVAFSAGALIGGAFLHLLPEVIMEVGLKENQLVKIFLYLLSGFCFFFILEQFISWHHHHATRHPEVKPFSYLILISDGIHNFIDGLIIAASFVVSLPLGLATTLAVALHEIPQEIGDFGVLIYGGFKKIKALFLNFLSGILAVIGGIVGFLISEKIGQSIIFLLPFAAGNFIYIASSDLIPEIKHKESFKKSIIYFFVFLLGIGLMWLMKLMLK
ncbi:MAG: ZIP family metal transporter [Candidatus Nealsonbacteria bacterium CG10_big_fil_rev_8_21_14_0_10_36_24]|uniref:ZIP family metal transporter n=2 Tax=Candidatus Nealsoniibacteriota TaxID=1817911 RepID=A0A2H0YN21_9BACT|nr:MAG: ZIP family metal transporter [Candidatus Nealsonbacteria bacterium CG10_big_fil_rev_8_21_14_0_10_36_24]PIS39816.1 MAG: ZIP family metal transporter [Candidatus Nealsonbacteria bacterium CG08_land_8_20_14_0_20_36_22]